MAKTLEIPLKDLKTSFYVRKKLDDDHVVQLSLLYEAGENLPPLVVSWDNEVIDGRHRKAALELLGRHVAQCVVHGQRGIGESIIIAMKANVGGALPPTKEDIVHSMVLLMNQGWNERRILDNMPFPREVARKYIQEATGAVLNAKLRAAMKAVSEENMTIKESAVKFGISLQKLQEHMNPSRKRREQRTAAWFKQHITRSYQGSHVKIAREINKAFVAFEDHQLSEAEVFDLFTDIYALIKKGEKRIDEHYHRFQALAKEVANLSKIDI